MRREWKKIAHKLFSLNWKHFKYVNKMANEEYLYELMFEHVSDDEEAIVLEAIME